MIKIEDFSTIIKLLYEIRMLKDFECLNFLPLLSLIFSSFLTTMFIVYFNPQMYQFSIKGAPSTATTLNKVFKTAVYLQIDYLAMETM